MSSKKPYKKSGTTWLSKNSKQLEKFSGQWVLFEPGKGLVSNSKSFQNVMKSAKKSKSKKSPYVFHVPSKEELLGNLL